MYYVCPSLVTVEHGKNPLFPCFILMINNSKERFDLKDV